MLHVGIVKSTCDRDAGAKGFEGEERGQEMKQYRYPSPIIAERIQKIFDDNNLTDGYVAKAINVDRKTILSFRHADANPSIKFIRWICDTYKIDANYLLDLR